MAEENNGGLDSSLVRLVITAALVGSVGSSGVTLYRTQDRFYGADGAVLDSKLDNLSARVEKLENRITRHVDSHPDRDLQKQISELRQDLIRIETRNGRN